MKKKKFNSHVTPREVELTVRLSINSELDKDELEYIRKRIERAIRDLECSCGLRVEEVSKIPFEPFDMKIGTATIKCTGDKTKVEDDFIKRGANNV